MGGRFGVFLVVVLVAAALWWGHVPDAGSRFEAMAIDTAAGRIELDGVTYTARFGDPVRLEGDVRLVQTVAHGPAPIITHQLVLTTGQYSDPEFAKLERYGRDGIRMEFPSQPEGTFALVHVIPANAAVVEALDAFPEGRAARIEGRAVVNASIDTSEGAAIRLHQTGHELLLADRITLR